MIIAGIASFRSKLSGLILGCGLALIGFTALYAFAGAAQIAHDQPAAAVSGNRRGEPIRPVPKPPDGDGRTALGETLFRDPRLSHGNARSCASCHSLETNGASPVALDAAPDGKPLQYNTPSVFNAALSFRQGWEGNLRTLEDGTDAAIQGRQFMASSWDEVLDKLRTDSALSARFTSVYGRDPDRESVLDAISAFEHTLLAPDSRFDRWLRGDDQALTSEELEGYRLFKSAGCVSCHQGVNVGANLYQRTDIFQPLFPGRAKRMLVASLRNVAVTPPYFDNGSATTLEEAINRMAKAQLGSQFKPDQLVEVAAFLRTLTGRYHGHDLAPAK